MPTNKPRAMITFNDEKLYKAVEEYRFEHRFRSQNEALMDLINKGIDVLLGETHAENDPFEKLTEEDRQVLKAYHAADPVSRLYAMHILDMEMPEKKKSRA